jgi:cytochrome c oxidase subunit 1
VFSTAGASILGLGYIIPMVYLLWSLRKEKNVGANPWNATGLEWTTKSPPITHNFEEIPVVTGEPYVYNVKEQNVGA